MFTYYFNAFGKYPFDSLNKEKNYAIKNKAHNIADVGL
jgi:hypothetical protein